MLAVLNLSSVAPDFMSAVKTLHASLSGVAFIACVGGITWLAILGLKGRAIHLVQTGSIRCLVVALLVGNLGFIGDAIEAAVDDLGSLIPGSNGNIMQMYTSAIKAKFGVDLGALNQLVPNAPFGGTSQPGTAMLTHYAYPGDSTPDPASANGIGNHNNHLTAYEGAGQVASAALTDSAKQYYGVGLGQTFSVTSASGQTFNLRYDDTAPESDMRVDVYDPNGLLPGGNNYSDSVVSESNGPVTAAENSPVGSFLNAMIHPAEAAGAAFFGLAVLFLSYVAVFIMWIMALVQAILFYAMIAVSPIFLGLLLVPGFENIAKHFLMKFLAICLWPIAFILAATVARFFINMALNSSNNALLGAGNVMGMQYFWMIGLAIWVLVSFTQGPRMIDKLLDGRIGIGDTLLAAAVTGTRAVRQSINAGIGGVNSISGAQGGSAGNGDAPARSTASFTPNYARRPMSTSSPTSPPSGGSSGMGTDA